MIDNSNDKTWSVFTYRADGATSDFAVIRTTWSKDGPGEENVIGTYPTEDKARGIATAAQSEYDRLRTTLLRAAREVNGL